MKNKKFNKEAFKIEIDNLSKGNKDMAENILKIIDELNNWAIYDIMTAKKEKNVLQEGWKKVYKELKEKAKTDKSEEQKMKLDFCIEKGFQLRNWMAFDEIVKYLKKSKANSYFLLQFLAKGIK
jgi:hypothetical protein